MSLAPGLIRDTAVAYLADKPEGAGLADITKAITMELGPVPSSSIRSYLNLNVPERFARVRRGHYALAIQSGGQCEAAPRQPQSHCIGLSTLYVADCMTWMSSQASNSFHALITDPPYGHVEYTELEQEKLRSGKGGIWRIPPSFDGHRRSPLPRFTVLDEADRTRLSVFFKNFARLVHRILVPGANVAVASNPLLSHLVSSAFAAGGFELRGTIVRLTMTMRGGDRPKNAHEEFCGVSVMPRSKWEPWIIARKPLSGRVQDNLRQWKTGGWRRPSQEQPFADVIRSSPTTKRERRIAPHPSLKPQSFMRQIVRAALPLGEGIVLDPFAGSGSTLAACNAVGYRSAGVEKDEHFVQMALSAIKPLGALDFVNPVSPELFDSVPI